MGLLGSRGPYAPRRNAVTIDWAAMHAASDKARAEIAVAEEAARRSRFEFHTEADPISQLVKRCAGIDERQDAFDKRLGLIEEQLQTIIDLLKEGQH